jgi:hypothetical protein
MATEKNALEKFAEQLESGGKAARGAGCLLLVVGGVILLFLMILI